MIGRTLCKKELLFAFFVLKEQEGDGLSRINTIIKRKSLSYYTLSDIDDNSDSFAQ